MSLGAQNFSLRRGSTKSNSFLQLRYLRSLPAQGCEEVLQVQVDYADLAELARQTLATMELFLGPLRSSPKF